MSRASRTNPRIKTYIVGTGGIDDKKGYGVKLSADFTVIVCTGATDKCIGVIADGETYVAGDAIDIVIGGDCEVLCGTGGLADGDFAGVDASGTFVAKTTDLDWIVGIAESTAAAAEYATVEISKFTLSVA